jgi:hypothetical protein
VSLTLLAVVTVMLATVGVARRRLRFADARGRLTWSLVAALPALLLLAAAVATIVIPTARMLLQSRLWQFASLYSWFAAAGGHGSREWCCCGGARQRRSCRARSAARRCSSIVSR